LAVYSGRSQDLAHRRRRFSRSQTQQAGLLFRSRLAVHLKEQLALVIGPSLAYWSTGFPLFTGFVAIAIAAPFQQTPLATPPAAQGFNDVFLDPSILIVSTMPYTEPWGGWPGLWNQWFEIFIPLDGSLVGQALDHQVFRIDPFDGLIYLSNERFVSIYF
jgi:hypothetical protein